MKLFLYLKNKRMDLRLQKEYEQLIQECAPRLLRIALSIVYDLEEAKDVCQDVFVKLISTPHIREKNAWLYRVTLHEALNHRKQSRNRKDRELKTSQIEGIHEDPLKFITQQELRNRLQEAIETLSENQKVIFFLRHEGEMPLHEIAKMLHISEGSVKKQLSRALEKLRIQLKQEKNS